MRIMLLGAPGAGKGTQAGFLINHFGVPQISTGDMLRNASEKDSKEGREIKAIMKSGALVHDELMINLVSQKLAEPACTNGYLLDGFPRTMAQAEALIEHSIYVDHVLFIDVADEQVVQRLSGRWTHLDSGRVYHNIYNPPQTSGIDDNTGEALVQRPDDKEATVRKRLLLYRQNIKPLLDFYQDLEQRKVLSFHLIDGVGTVDEIKNKILSVF